MPGGLTKFQEHWLEVNDCNGDSIGSWCTKGKTEGEAKCLLCKCTLSISNSGISTILKHAERGKHIKGRKLMRKQITFKSPSNNSDTTSSNSCTFAENNLSFALTSDQLITRAEALWALKVAASDFSFGSCKDIAPLFQLMFESDQIASKMKLGDRKISYVISHGLGPYFQTETISDLKSAINNGGYFTLSFDEATTAQIKKQLDIHFRYWSPKHNSVLSSYFTSLFLGHADAKIICKSILETLKGENISITKILMLNMDGPNTNLLVAKKVNEELLKLGSKELVDIGTCSLHKVHNCFAKALGELPLDIDEFCVDLFAFFKHSAARREDLQKLQRFLECEELFLLRHVNSRWLTLGPIVERILLVYESLLEYFLHFLPKQKNSFGVLQNNSRYKRIVNNLKRKETLVFLQFVVALTPNLQAYLALFQTEGPLVHMMYFKMNELLRNILLMFMKDEIVSNLEGKKFFQIDFDNFESYKTLSEIEIGSGTKKALLLLKENPAKEAKMALRSCLIRLAKLLKASLPLTNPVLRDLEILHPSMRNKPNNAIQRLCTNLKPLNIQDKELDKIILEWHAYKTDTEVSKICKEFSENPQRIDEFWSKVFELKDVFTSKPRFQNLSFLIKNCLILAHGNADVERGFSLNTNILSKKRLGVSESTIIGLRHIKDALKRHGGIFSIPITGKLLNSVAKSYSLYAAEKEAVAKASEEEKKRKESEEHEKQQNEQRKKRKLEISEKRKTEIEKVEFLQEELNSANRCLSENNDVLREAIKVKDFMKVRIVSKVIETSTNNIQKITKELSSAQDKLHKIQQSI